LVIVYLDVVSFCITALVGNTKEKTVFGFFIIVPFIAACLRLVSLCNGFYAKRRGVVRMIFLCELFCHKII
jgi:hypothetical protein